ncbi:secreted RxLR effector protein 161-like [Ipomoea triloba]|uniref:secreted RxLR effector protein 161-like n=1 Tax=Ipomoea triloba TaxID=35885 RepID=UPI00125D5D77|nr:secreted RxLR effector protein 161-like [Ipomoea triloba]
MYLANNTRPDIAFSINLLARYSSCPTQRHWNGIKHIVRYLQRAVDLGLFYAKDSKLELVGYADAGYDPHKARSQTGYLFISAGAAISWRSTKQTLVATSSNHVELIAIHEASRESATIYEDNAACIAQLKEGYIKGDRIKHISPKFFFTHDL